MHMRESNALAERIQHLLAHLPAVREQKMFGGIAFLVYEKLCVGVYGNGELLLRCDPESADELATKPGARWAEMKGKPMGKGCLFIRPEQIPTQKELNDWIDIALEYHQKIR